MNSSWDTIAEAVKASLSTEEKHTSIVYLMRRLYHPGDSVDLGGQVIQTSSEAAVAFVDLEPGVNWGHRCRYLIVNVQSGEIRSYEAQHPPFLTAVPADLHPIWKGDSAPDWAVARSE